VSLPEYCNKIEGVTSLSVNAIVKVTGDNIDNALRLLKRKVEREGVIRDIKKHAYYEKPTEVRRKKILKAERKHQKLLKRQEIRNKNY